jgi:hypothetical protein
MINAAEIKITRDPDRPYVEALFPSHISPPTQEIIEQYAGWILVFFRARYKDKSAIYYQGVSEAFLNDEPLAGSVLEKRAREEFVKIFERESNSASPQITP